MITPSRTDFHNQLFHPPFPPQTLRQLKPAIQTPLESHCPAQPLLNPRPQHPRQQPVAIPASSSFCTRIQRQHIRQFNGDGEPLPGFCFWVQRHDRVGIGVLRGGRGRGWLGRGGGGGGGGGSGGKRMVDRDVKVDGEVEERGGEPFEFFGGVEG
jgi:hypothetical protein